MKECLQSLNRTPGVLGSAYVDADTTVFDMGESLGGAEAAPLVRKAAEACSSWMNAQPRLPLETAVFVGASGRIVVRPAGAGVLVAFAENDASAGLLRLKLREIADQISGAPERANHQ